MDQPLRKFVARSPRYVLRPNDRQIVRYASENASGPMAIHTTGLMNISETGMAILADHNAAPHVGERLKIELPIPGGDQIAWWGKIVRVELFQKHWWSNKEFEGEDKVIIGVRFEDLPKGHRRAIQSGLEARFIEELKERRRRQFLFLEQYWFQNWMKIVGYVFVTAAALGLLYWLSRPAPGYDSKRGAPWGHRFQFLDFDTDK